MNNPFTDLNLRLDNIESLLGVLLQKSEQSEPIKRGEDLLNVTQAAELLSLKPQSIYGKVSKRELPHIKNGGRLYFLRKELLEYLKRGKRMNYQEFAEEADAYLNQKGGKHGK